MPVSLRERVELPKSHGGQGLDAARELAGLLRRQCETFPDCQPLTILDRQHDEHRLPLGALWQRAREVRSALGERGLRRGDMVAVILPTGFEIIATFFGVMLGGAVPGLIPPPSNRFADENIYAAHLTSILERFGTRFVIAEPAVAELLLATPALRALPCQVLQAAELRAAAGAFPIVERSPEEVVLVQYSSGSTGLPKGVLLQGGAVVNNVRATAARLALGAADVSVNWIPLYHDMGLIDALLMPLLCGLPTVLIPTLDFLRDPSLWLWAVHRYRGSLSFAPNFAFALCAARIADRHLEGLDLSSWRASVSASEPVLPETVDAFCERFAPYGFRRSALKPAWGLAESVCLLTGIGADEEPRSLRVDRDALAQQDLARPVQEDGVRLTSCGRPYANCQLEIRNAAGTVHGEGELGEVWARSDCLLLGYHGDPERTAAILQGGWLDTGDRGFLHEGHLYFVAREKDLIVIGGEKYAPQEIESVLNTVPGVRAGCAVAFGVMNRNRGTEDVAVVAETRLTGEDELQALREAIRTEVARHTGLGVRHVLLVPPGGVTKTTSGKLARGATEARYHEHWA